MTLHQISREHEACTCPENSGGTVARAHDAPFPSSSSRSTYTLCSPPWHPEPITTTRPSGMADTVAAVRASSGTCATVRHCAFPAPSRATRWPSRIMHMRSVVCVFVPGAAQQVLGHTPSSRKPPSTGSHAFVAGSNASAEPANLPCSCVVYPPTTRNLPPATQSPRGSSRSSAMSGSWAHASASGSYAIADLSAFFSSSWPPATYTFPFTAAQAKNDRRGPGIAAPRRHEPTNTASIGAHVSGSHPPATTSRFLPCPPPSTAATWQNRGRLDVGPGSAGSGAHRPSTGSRSTIRYEFAGPPEAPADECCLSAGAASSPGAGDVGGCAWASASTGRDSPSALRRRW
nr:unnamed protein product [Digitaria exilis]